MRFSKKIGQTPLAPGEFYQGGYHFADAQKTRIIGYDLIKNMKKLDRPNGFKRWKRQYGPAYMVEVSRMNCIPPPPQLVNPVDYEVETVPDLTSEIISYTYKLSDPGQPVPFPAQPQGLAYKLSGGGCCPGDCCPPAPSQNCCPGDCCPTPPPQNCCPGSCCKHVCFAEDTLMTTPEGKVKVQHLKVGDFVLSYDVGGVHYVPVNSFWHYDPEKEAHFIRLKTEMEEDLVLSDLHFVFAITCNEEKLQSELKTINKKLIFAKDLTEKHCLVSISDEKSVPKVTKILAISKERRRGVYAPMTSNGRLVAQEILASCYSVVKEPYLLHSVFPWSDSIDQAVTGLMEQWFGVKREKFQNNPEIKTQRKYLPFLIDFGLGVIDKMIIYSKLV